MLKNIMLKSIALFFLLGCINASDFIGFGDVGNGVIDDIKTGLEAINTVKNQAADVVDEVAATGSDFANRGRQALGNLNGLKSMSLDDLKDKFRGKDLGNLTIDELKNKLPDKMFKDFDSLKLLGNSTWNKRQAKEIVDRMRDAATANGTKIFRWGKDKISNLKGIIKGFEPKEISALPVDSLKEVAANLTKDQLEEVMRGRIPGMQLPDLTDFLKNADPAELWASLRELNEPPHWKKEHSKAIVDQFEQAGHFETIGNWNKTKIDELGMAAGVLLKGKIGELNNSVFREVGQKLIEGIKHSNEFKKESAEEKRQTLKDLASKYEDAFGPSTDWTSEKVEDAGIALAGLEDLDAIPDDAIKDSISTLGERWSGDLPTDMTKKIADRLRKPGVMGNAKNWTVDEVRNLKGLAPTVMGTEDIKNITNAVFKDTMDFFADMADRGKVAKPQLMAMGEKAKEVARESNKKIEEMLGELGGMAAGLDVEDLKKMRNATQAQLEKLSNKAVRLMDPEQIIALGEGAVKKLQAKARNEITGEKFENVTKEIKKALIEASLKCDDKCPAAIKDLEIKFVETLKQADADALVEKVRSILTEKRKERGEESKGTDVAPEVPVDGTEPGFEILLQSPSDDAITSRRRLVEDADLSDTVVVRVLGESVEVANALGDAVNQGIAQGDQIGEQTIESTVNSETVDLNKEDPEDKEDDKNPEDKKDDKDDKDSNGDLRIAPAFLAVASVVVAACA